MVKTNKREHISYTCEYCKNIHYSKDKAVLCEQSHTPVGIGDTVSYIVTKTYHDHGKPSEYNETKTGTILKTKKGEFLVELNDGSRKWVNSWKYYRDTKW